MLYRFLWIAALLTQTSTIYAIDDSKKSAAEKPKTTTQRYYFYNSDGIGAHAFYSPHIFVIESGTEAMYYRRVDQYPYGRGLHNVYKSVSNPHITIRNYGGYNKFFQDQFLPKSNGAFAPNYGWHLFGGGARSRLLEEYYIDKGYAYPTLLSWTTLYIGHIGNEAAQAESADEGSVDAIADLMFFDWVGKTMFLSDDVSEYVSEDLNYKEWTFQLSYDPVNKRMVNNGQQYWLRYPLSDHFSVSLLTGNIHNSLVLTLNNEAGEQWSIGGGFKPESIEWSEENDEPRSNQLTYSLMTAYSINDNPFVTAFLQSGSGVSMSEDGAPKDSRDEISNSRKLVVNLYPGWNKHFSDDLGITFGSLYEGFFLGFTSGYAPAGLHYQSHMAERYKDDY